MYLFLWAILLRKNILFYKSNLYYVIVIEIQTNSYTVKIQCYPSKNQMNAIYVHVVFGICNKNQILRLKYSNKCIKMHCLVFRQ